MNEDSLERYREPVFVLAFCGGMLVFALGSAFLILGIVVNTAPPAPYVSPSDRQLLMALSAGAVVVGVGIVRLAGKVVGW